MLQCPKNFSTIEMIPQNMIIHKGSKKSVVCAREGGANTTPLSLISFVAYFTKRNTNLTGGESEDGQKFLPPNPLPFCPPERSVWRAERAVSSVQKRFGFRQTNAPLNFLLTKAN